MCSHDFVIFTWTSSSCLHIWLLIWMLVHVGNRRVERKNMHQPLSFNTSWSWVLNGVVKRLEILFKQFLWKLFLIYLITIFILFPGCSRSFILFIFDVWYYAWFYIRWSYHMAWIFCKTVPKKVISTCRHLKVCFNDILTRLFLKNWWLQTKERRKLYSFTSSLYNYICKLQKLMSIIRLFWNHNHFFKTAFKSLVVSYAHPLWTANNRYMMVNCQTCLDYSWYIVF